MKVKKRCGEPETRGEKEVKEDHKTRRWGQGKEGVKEGGRK